MADAPENEEFKSQKPCSFQLIKIKLSLFIIELIILDDFFKAIITHENA